MARWRPTWLHDFRVPGSVCPHCYAYADGALAVTDVHPPKPGDAMLCIACGGWCFYTDDLTRRVPTWAEAERLAADADAQHAWAVWAERYRRPR